MKRGKWAAALATTWLTACATTPPTHSPTYQVQMGEMPGGMQGESAGGMPGEGRESRITASSYNVSGGTAYTASRATDGNPDTEWASRDGDTRATLSLAMPQRTRFTAVRIKAQPTKESYYVVEVSDDGNLWRRISDVLEARDWKTETKPVINREGNYIRVRWMKHTSDMKHWSVFEFEPIGTPVGPGTGGGG